MNTEEYYGGTYPSPPDPEEVAKEVKATITISFDIEEFFPKDWDYDEIKSYILSNYNDFYWKNEKVEDVDL